MTTTLIESLLLASGKPVSIALLKKTLDLSTEVLEQTLEDMVRRYNTQESGIHLIVHDGTVVFTTNPATAEIVRVFLKQEMIGELTRPSLETLTIIAYRGPITKPEIEQIRGVNCSLILRNLLIRGLIEERDDTTRLQSVYTVAVDFLKHLGIHCVQELPDYDKLNTHDKISELMMSTPDE